MLEPTKTLEEMLRAIIEAQVRGGCEKYLFLIDGATLGAHHIRFSEALEILDTGYCACGARSRYILEILLDTNGLKAAYGERVAHDFDFSAIDEPCKRCKLRHGQWVGDYCTPGYIDISHSILDAWHSGPGNNLQAAIETAYKLLPPKA